MYQQLVWAALLSFICSRICEPISVSVGDWEPGLHLIDLEQMSRIVDDQSAIIVDGRPDLFFEFGHIPGAENLACKEFDEDYQRLEKRLKPAKEGTVPLVICSGLSANS